MLSDELDREFTTLAKQEIPLYYMAYRVSDVQTVSLAASFGYITDAQEDRSRLFNIALRVGSYDFDNTHITNDEGFGFLGSFLPEINLPLDNNDLVIRNRIWFLTDINYKAACTQYSNKKAVEDAKKKSPDFSPMKPYHYEEPPVENNLVLPNRKDWEEKLRNYSSAFADKKEFINGSAQLRFENERKYFVSSEGSRIAQNRHSAILILSASVVSADGENVPLDQVYYAETPEGLPSSDSVMRAAWEMVSDLYALRKVSKAEPYTGPAIMSAKASGVFFHEIFGHRIEGSRMNNRSDGQTFTEKVGKVVLNKNLSVYSDPTMKYYGNQLLAGYYKFDDEGVPAQRVEVVENGILKNFLMSRKPVGEFQVSNGHGRSAPGQTPVSRQSNMIIKAIKTHTDAQLRNILIKKCKKSGLEYGYYIAEVEGGFTMTQREMPNAFNIIPRLVYKVYVNGRPDELVRGVTFIGTPLVMFSEIAEAGDTPGVFSGMCGAESGPVPVSTVSPALLINKVETQKEPESKITLPILPKPGITVNTSDRHE